MDGVDERILIGCPTIISYDCTKKIMEQMEKNICKIRIGDQQGTGFFCKIPFPDENNMLPVLITNNHIINYELLYKENSTIAISSTLFENKILNLNDRIKRTNKEYDTTIIEIKETDKIENYLELDDYILDDIINSENNNDIYIEKTLYIIQYPEGHLSASYGILETINNEKKYYFYHKCSTKDGSSGSPILNLNNKIIGIHSIGRKNDKTNKGIFLNYPIKEFIELNTVDENKEKDEAALKAFNEYLNLDIKDTKIEKLNLMWKIKDFDLYELTKVNFKNLKELLISGNINNIYFLEKTKFEKLEILDLKFCSLETLKSFSNLKYNKLKKINLLSNKVSDLKGLDIAKFPQLEILDLNNNQISDITLLHNMNFKNLKELFLNSNYISDLKVFEKVKFDKLENFDLSNNKIEVIDGLEKANFKLLKQLDLSKNLIKDTKQFEKINNLNNLNKLGLRGNKIEGDKYKELYSYLKSKYKNNIYIF